MKMRKIRYVQLGLILAFTLIVGTCLPPFISRIPAAFAVIKPKRE